MTIGSENLLQSVKLSQKDWRNIVSLLAAMLVIISGATYAMASSMISDKTQEIKESAGRILTLETQMQAVRLNASNYEARQVELLNEVKKANEKMGDIGLSVARIEGRLGVANIK